MAQDALKATLTSALTSLEGVAGDITALKQRISALEAAGQFVDPEITALAESLASKLAALDAETPAAPPAPAPSADEPPPGDPGPG